MIKYNRNFLAPKHITITLFHYYFSLVENEQIDVDAGVQVSIVRK